MKELTNEEIIGRIGQLIDNGKGDPGRLDSIRQAIQNNRILFNSDRQYLDKLLDFAPMTKTSKVSQNTNPFLLKVKRLIDSGIGDYGRLQYIYEFIQNGKSLYQSDYDYLQRKLSELPDEPSSSETEIQKPLENKPIRETMPKGWSSESDTEYDSDKDNNLTDDSNKPITSEFENQELSKLKKISQEQEKQIEVSKLDVESQIQVERKNIASQIKQVEQIAEQKRELEKVKSEQISVLDKIKKEREEVLQESALQKEELVKVQQDQEQIEKKLDEDQNTLVEMQELQKSRLQAQSELSQQLNQQKSELEKTQAEYEEIRTELDKEQEEFDKNSAKQKENLTKLQEKAELEKAQADYDDLLNQIEQQKQEIATQTNNRQNACQARKTIP